MLASVVAAVIEESTLIFVSGFNLTVKA